jgi:menaquinone-dependent protoporphyrinogen oxidase
MRRHRDGPRTDLSPPERTNLPVWLFSSGPVGDPSGKLARSLERDPADINAIREDISPQDYQVFAGKLDPGVLSFPHASHVIFHSASGDYRNRTEITRWADEIARQLTALQPLPQP